MRRKILWILVTLALILVIISTYTYIYSIKHFNATPDAKENSEMILDIRNRGEAFYKKKYFQSYVAAYTIALKAAPGNVETKNKLSEAYFELARIELESGDAIKAKTNLSKAIELDPDNEEAKEILRKIE